jgi:hypothetical protein
LLRWSLQQLYLVYIMAHSFEVLFDVNSKNFLFVPYLNSGTEIIRLLVFFRSLNSYLPVSLVQITDFRAIVSPPQTEYFRSC